MDGTDSSSVTVLRIQRLVVPEYPVFAEGDAAIAGEIGLDVWPRGDAIVQIDQPWYLALKGLHPPRKGITQPFDELKHRQIDVGQPAAGDVTAAVALQQPLEIAEGFRHPFVPEFIGALFRGRFLILVIQRRPEGMMSVVNFRYEISHRELQLM